MDAIAIGGRLRQEREKKKKTLNEVSDALDISKSALAMYETGRRIPRDTIKARLSRYYGRSIASLFYAEDVHSK